ncbi:MAG: hypothetical protein HYT16_03290 [DPANN group archaeon]|nr:hypothetical protein [DPANN group archaeon]
MVAIGEILSTFAQILTSPLQNPEMLWIIVPIYLNWVLTDYWQERKGTSFGNAMSNGFVALWVGLDWTKQLFRSYSEASGSLAVKLIISILFIAYGLFIMKEVVQAKPIAHYLGRIREISYFAIVATPIYYGAIQITGLVVLSILVFLPVWYFLTEAIDRALPAPKGDEDSTGDMGSKGLDLGAQNIDMGAQDFGVGDMNAGMPNQQFGAPQQGQWPPQF